MKVLLYSHSSNFELHLKAQLEAEIQIQERLEGLRFASTNTISIIHRNSFDDSELINAIQESGQITKIALADDDPKAEQMLRFTDVGVRAYCNSFMVKEHYVQLLQMLESDQSWFPPFLLEEVFKLARGKTVTQQNTESLLRELTPREKEIAVSVSEGLSNKEVARNLTITERTVKAHLSNVFEKLHVKDRMALSILLRD